LFEPVTLMPGASYNHLKPGRVALFLRYQEHRPIRARCSMPGERGSCVAPKFGECGDAVVVTHDGDEIVTVVVDERLLRRVTEKDHDLSPVLREFVDATSVGCMRAGSVVSLRPGVYNPCGCPHYVVMGMNKVRPMTVESSRLNGHKQLRLGFIDVTKGDEPCSGFFMDEELVCQSEPPVEEQ